MQLHVHACEVHLIKNIKKNYVCTWTYTHVRTYIYTENAREIKYIIIIIHVYVVIGNRINAPRLSYEATKVPFAHRQHRFSAASRSAEETVSGHDAL